MADKSENHDRRIDYVEFNVADIAAAKAFYGSAFGWRFTDYGPNYYAAFVVDPDGYRLEAYCGQAAG